jgi:hypothetical protein
VKMILGSSPLKIVSVNAVLYPRWLPLLKIEFFSNGQNCSILSQKVPKFEKNLGTFWLKIEQFWPLQPSWIQDGIDGHNFERGRPKDHFSKVWSRLAQ